MRSVTRLIARPMLLFHLASAWRARQRSRFGDAARAYRAALALAPRDNNLRIQLGNMLKDAGRRREAEAVYLEAISRDPSCAETRLQLGHVLKLMGRRDEAVEAYRAALSLDAGLDAARRELFALGDSAVVRAVLERQSRDAGLPPLLDSGGRLAEPTEPTAARSLAPAMADLIYPVDCYGWVRRLYDLPPPASRAPQGMDQARPRIGVVLAADPVGALEALQDQLTAVREQTLACHRLAVFGSDPVRRALVERASAGDWRLSWTETETGSTAAQERAIALALAVDWVLLLGPGARLHPLALEWLAAIAARTNCDAIFFDEEVADHEGSSTELRPILRHTFDPDSLLEANIYGDTLAIAASALAGLAAPAETLSILGSRSAILLALSRGGRIAHAPLPLIRRSSSDAQPVETAAIEHATAVCDYLGAGFGGTIRAASASTLKLDRAPTRPDALICVVIPTKDNLADLRALVESLGALADRPDAFRVLILNNGVPRFREALEAAFQRDVRVSVRDAPGAFNWSRLSNLGAAMTAGPYLLFANDDMRMLTQGWDRTLRSLLERQDVGAVGARLLYPDNAIQHAGILFAWQGGVVHDGLYESGESPGPGSRWRLTRSVSAVTGAFLGVRRETFDAVGGFDEVSLRVSYSDVDLALKLRARGLRILWTPDISLHHFESKTRGLDGLDPIKAARNAEERRTLERRWPGLLDFEPSLNPAWSDAALPHRLLRSPPPEVIWRYIERSAAQNPWLAPPPTSD